MIIISRGTAKYNTPVSHWRNARQPTVIERERERREQYSHKSKNPASTTSGRNRKFQHASDPVSPLHQMI